MKPFNLLKTFVESSYEVSLMIPNTISLANNNLIGYTVYKYWMLNNDIMMDGINRRESILIDDTVVNKKTIEFMYIFDGVNLLSAHQLLINNLLMDDKNIVDILFDRGGVI